MGEAKEVTDGEAVIVIPRWFVGLVAFILTGAIPWCLKVNVDMATIATKLDAALVQQAKDTGWLKERVERVEVQVDEISTRLRSLEGKKQ